MRHQNLDDDIDRAAVARARALLDELQRDVDAHAEGREGHVGAHLAWVSVRLERVAAALTSAHRSDMPHAKPSRPRLRLVN